MKKNNSHIYFKRSGDIPFRIVDEEAVLVSPKEGEVTVLNKTGTKIWQSLGVKRTPCQIAKLIIKEFEVEKEEAYTDCLEFLRDLERKGFIKSVS
jgi:hypothetical protein